MNLCLRRSSPAFQHELDFSVGPLTKDMKVGEQREKIVENGREYLHCGGCPDKERKITIWLGEFSSAFSLSHSPSLLTT